MDFLKAIFSKVRCFESKAKLHALVFIAQEMNLVNKKQYEFDYSLNLPFSESLERDYLILHDAGFVCENEEGYIVANGSLDVKDVEKIIANDKLQVLEELSAFSAKDLINISRLLYLRKTYPEINNEEKLSEKAKAMFFISGQSFRDIFNRLNASKLKLVFGEV